ncbi:MAG: 23S rRNA (uracil(1939)-C(5))-methyltransferase RlmD, partial [Gemmiger sp.]
MTQTCPLAARHCGGCPLLAVPYPQQLHRKQARLQTLLGGLGPVEPILGMEQPWHYRNKAIASFSTQGGRLVCGLYAEGTHRVLPGCGCLLQDERLNQVLDAVLQAARLCHYTAYDEDRGTGLLRHVVVRVGHATGQVLVTLVTAAPALPGSRNFVAALRRLAPAVTTVVHNVNPTRSSAVLGNREKILYGPGHILDTLCRWRFAISSRSFYQVNPVQTEHLYAAALALAGLTGRETVVDAYCGIGTIGLCAASHARSVLGVELNPAAVRDAAANARRNGVQNARFLCADATQWMTRAAGEGLRPDVVFLDP